MIDITLSQMLVNIEKELPYLWRFVTGATFLAGFFFAFRAIYLFKEYGELRTMMATSTDIRKPLISMLVAVGLLYWPTLYKAMTISVFNNPVVYSYHIDTATANFNKMVNILGHIIQFIGFIAFIRGWILLTHIAQPGTQPGTVGKALCHIAGGILAINIFGTWSIIASTLGFT